MKRFLHVGCGPANQWHLQGCNSFDWSEIRFDIDPDANPDIQGTVTDMNAVAAASVDAIYSSHDLERAVRGAR